MSGSGEGQHTRTLCEHTPHVLKPERVSNQSQGLRDMGPMHALAFKDAAKSDIRRAGCRLIPLRVQLGAKLTRSAPLGPSEYVHIESCLALEHVIDRPAQLMRQDAQGFTLVMRVLQTAQKLLALGIVTQE